MISKILTIIRNFRRHRCGQMAGTIAFFMLFSSFPLIILILAAIKMLLGDIPGIEAKIVEISEVLIPSVSQWIKSGIVGIVKKGGTQHGNIIGIFVLTWSSLQLYNSIKSAFKVISDFQKDPNAPQNKIRQFLKNILYPIPIGMILVAVFTVSLVPIDLLYKSLVANSLLPDIWLTKNIIYFAVKSKIIAIVAILLLLTTVFKLLLPTRVLKRNCFIGAVIFTLLFTLAKVLYVFYLEVNMNSLRSIYGVFTTSFIVVIWFYYIALLFLFCAEVVVVLKETKPGIPFKNKG